MGSVMEKVQIDGLPKTSAALTDLRRSIDGLKGALGTSPQALRLRAKRMELIASDIANADSSFADKALDFKAIMAKELAPSVRYDQTMKHLTDRVERIRNSLRGDK